jgi:hypothetical protein
MPSEGVRDGPITVIGSTGQQGGVKDLAQWLARANGLLT